MSRIGGAFPFPVPGIVNGGGVVSLSSGEVFYPPAGNYIVSCGDQSVLQFWDSVSQLWRNFGPPGANAMNFATDGYNWRLFNASGVVVGTTITNAGTTGTNGIGATATGASVSFGAAPTNGRFATGYPIVGGAINTTIAITQAGSGFLTPPLLIIDPPPPGGIQATAVCRITVSTGAIAAVTVVNAGAGYAAVPNVTIIPQPTPYQGGPSGSFAAGANPPPGLVFPACAAPGNQNTSATGAQLTVNATLAGSGTLTGIVIVDPGQLYTGTSIPTVTITGVGAAAATAIMSMALSSVTVTNAGAAVSVAPAFTTSGGLIVRYNNNSRLLYRPASGSTTLSTTTVGTGVVEDRGFGFQSVPVIGVLPAGGTIWTTIPTLTAVVGGGDDSSILWPSMPA